MTKQVNFFVRGLVLVLTVIIIDSCVSPVDFPVEYKRNEIVISGQISTITDRNIVTVATTASSERRPVPISGADVMLIDSDGNYYLYGERREGEYHLPDFPGVAGKTYYLRVSLPDGRIYESVPEQMPNSSGIVEPYFSFEFEEKFDSEGVINNFLYANVYTNATFTEQSPEFVKWNVEEVYLIRPTNFPDPFGYVPPDCFITQNADPQSIALLDRSEFKTNEIKGLRLASRRIDQSFHYRHFLNVFQSGITKEAYEYWHKVQVVSTQTGSIFDTPPATIKGNFRNVLDAEEMVHGYFQAANEQVQRMVIIQGDLPYPLTPYCDYDQMRSFDSYPAECLECIRVRNASYDRPWWF